MRRTIVAAVALCCAAVVLPDAAADTPPSAVAPAPLDAATTYQGNALHDGSNPHTTLPVGLVEAWRHDFNGDVAYPLLVNGRVFAVASLPSGGQGADLYALDAATGSVLWGPVSVGGSYHIDGIAADTTNVYSINYNGLLKAVDQATGQIVWSAQMPNQWIFTSPPIVDEGTVYVAGAGSDGTIYAVDASTGAIRWMAHVTNADHSSPAITQDAVFVSSSGLVTHRLNRWTGSNEWTHTTGGYGGGGRTPVVHDGKVYVRDSHEQIVLSAETGQVVGTFASTRAPAFDGDTGYFMTTTLRAIDLTTGEVRWSQAGDDKLVTAPIVADGKVVVGSATGRVYMYDAATGAELWTRDTGLPIDAPEETHAYMLAGLAVAESTLLVSASDVLVAYRPGLEPTSTTVSSSPNPSTSGQPVTLTATVTPMLSGIGLPTGAVDFYDGTTMIGSAPLSPAGSSSRATLTVTTLNRGTHAVSTSYAGDATFDGSSSAPLNHFVEGLPTVLSADPAILKLSPLSVPLFKLSATLTSPDGTPLAGRTLSFAAGSRALCTTVTSANGTATCTGSNGVLDIVLANGYVVTYAGSAAELPAWASGPLVG